MEGRYKVIVLNGGGARGIYTIVGIVGARATQSAAATLGIYFLREQRRGQDAEEQNASCLLPVKKAALFSKEEGLG